MAGRWADSEYWTDKQTNKQTDEQTTIPPDWESLYSHDPTGLLLSSQLYLLFPRPPTSASGNYMDMKRLRAWTFGLERSTTPVIIIVTSIDEYPT